MAPNAAPPPSGLATKLWCLHLVYQQRVPRGPEQVHLFRAVHVCAGWYSSEGWRICSPRSESRHSCCRSSKCAFVNQSNSNKLSSFTPCKLGVPIFICISAFMPFISAQRCNVTFDELMPHEKIKTVPSLSIFSNVHPLCARVFS